MFYKFIGSFLGAILIVAVILVLMFMVWNPKLDKSVPICGSHPEWCQ